MAAIADDLLSELEGVRGDLLRPADDGYDEARRIHNAMIDKRPGLIVRCRGTRGRRRSGESGP